MWRFMLITFGFLGFAFYELSGGADYEPHANSIQARAGQTDPVSIAELEPTDVPSIAELAQSVPEAAPAERLGITLASIRVDETSPAAQLEAKTARVTAAATPVDEVQQAALDTAEDDARKVWPGAIELFQLQEAKRVQRKESIKAVQQDALAAQSDIRYVTGDLVNMRGGPSTDFAPVTQLSVGTEVAVLDAPGNGWLMLRVTETGEEGWMADWLVSDAVN